MEPYAIFFSYKREDEPFVQKVHSDLRLRAVKRIWLDQQTLMPGDQWDAECVRAIHECSHMVVFVSRLALNSVQVKREYELATALSKIIIPVFIEPGLSYPQLPQVLKQYQGIALNSLNTYDAGIGQLVRSLPRYSYVLPSVVRVEMGRFSMGGPGEEHSVWLDEYWIGLWTITLGEFSLFVQAGGLSDTRYWPAGTSQTWLESFAHLRYLPASNLEDYALQHPRQPVRGVTWAHAFAYCNWLNYAVGRQNLFALPSEAQWEKAARGLDSRAYPWGNSWIDGIANTSELGSDSAVDCGQLGHHGDSPFGCQDMAGNVWEWTASRPFPLPYIGDGSREPPPESNEPRVMRGGSWVYPRGEARTFTRASEHPIPQMYRHEVGFRLVASEDPSIVVSQ